MDLPHGGRQPAPPRRIQVAKPAVAVPLRFGGPVFLPGQQQRHARAAQLGMNAGPDWLRPQRLGGREGRHEEPALQRRVVQLRRHWPGDAHHAGTAQVLGDRVAADADYGRDLVAALATDVLETKNLSNLTHRQSLAWHGYPRCHSETTLPWVDDCPRTAPPAPTQGRLECLGRGGWLASESPAGIRRNPRLASVGIRSPDRVHYGMGGEVGIRSGACPGAGSVPLHLFSFEWCRPAASRAATSPERLVGPHMLDRQPAWDRRPAGTAPSRFAAMSQADAPDRAG